MKNKEINALRKLVDAWESLHGGTNYSPSIIQSWLVDDMKPAIDNARRIIRNSRMKKIK